MSSTPRTHLTPVDAKIDEPRIGFAPRCELVGRTIRGKYRVLEHIGQGGLADVFEVRYIPGACRLAMKVLRPDASAEDRRRFQHEFRTLLHLDHPGLVRVVDYDQLASGQPFFTMELLRGRSLERAFDLGERVAPERVIRIAKQVCSILAALHRQRIIHRDIKPANLFLLDPTGDDPRDRVKVLDLGIVRLTTGYYEAASNVLELTPQHERLRTRPGFILGTPGYIAPECARGENSVKRDVFSVGVTMYRLLTGKRAFPTNDPSHVPITEYVPDAPEGLAELVDRALAGEPDERFESIEAMAAALDVVLETSTARMHTPIGDSATPRRWPYMLGSFLLGALTAATPLMCAHRADRSRAESPGDEAVAEPPPAKASRDLAEKSSTPAPPAADMGTREPKDSTEADQRPETPTSPARAARSGDKPTPRDAFRRAMTGASGSIDVCLRGAELEPAPLTVRARLERGRVADVTLSGPALPAIVDVCLRDTIAKIPFPDSLNGTFTHRFTS